MPQFDYTVDGMSQQSDARQLTARTILTNAGLSPTERYLIELHGKDQESYKDKLDAPIHMHERAKFITASLGPTGVS